jgi:hypothetical protein
LRLDAFGNPLPRPAIARIGTSRMRHQAHDLGLIFSPDGKQLASTGWGGVQQLTEVLTYDLGCSR